MSPGPGAPRKTLRREAELDMKPQHLHVKKGGDGASWLSENIRDVICLFHTQWKHAM